MIQSGVITDSFLELHIPYNPQLNYSIISECEGMKGAKTREDAFVEHLFTASTLLFAIENDCPIFMVSKNFLALVLF